MDKSKTETNSKVIRKTVKGIIKTNTGIERIIKRYEKIGFILVNDERTFSYKDGKNINTYTFVFEKEE